MQGVRALRKRDRKIRAKRAEAQLGSHLADEIDLDTKIESLMRCPKCNREMRMFGVEPLNETRELYTFECDLCGQLEVRGIRIG